MQRVQNVLADKSHVADDLDKAIQRLVAFVAQLPGEGRDQPGLDGTPPRAAW